MESQNDRELVKEEPKADEEVLSLYNIKNKGFREFVVDYFEQLAFGLNDEESMGHVSSLQSSSMTSIKSKNISDKVCPERKRKLIKKEKKHIKSDIKPKPRTDEKEAFEEDLTIKNTNKVYSKNKKIIINVS